MKRIYVPKKKSEKRGKIEKEALGQLRRTRAQMKKEYPDLLDDIQKCYQAAQKSRKPEAPAPEARDHSAQKTEYVPIDRAKNMETIARFLQITNSEAIKKALRKEMH